MKKIKYSWGEFFEDVAGIIDRNNLETAFSSLVSPLSRLDKVYGIPRGGTPLALQLSSKLGITFCEDEKSITANTLICDDIIDSGKTREKFMDNFFVSLHSKIDLPERTYSVHKTKSWIVYPWEELDEQKGPTDAVVRLIQFIGDDPNREGLIETPKRVMKSYVELFSGYKQEPKDIFKVFDAAGCNELVLLKNIELYSLCEHHMLPFLGQVHIGYIPDKKVIGISKLARLVEIFARRLQIQERLGEQITDCLMELLEPLGAACIIEAQHLCMRMRGINKQNSIMQTSSLKGLFLEDTDKGRAARQEFMGLIK